MSLTQIIIGDIVPLAKRGAWSGLFGGVWGVASVLGPLLGEYLPHCPLVAFGSSLFLRQRRNSGAKGRQLAMVFLPQPSDSRHRPRRPLLLPQAQPISQTHMARPQQDIRLPRSCAHHVGMRLSRCGILIRLGSWMGIQGHYCTSCSRSNALPFEFGQLLGYQEECDHSAEGLEDEDDGLSHASESVAGHVSPQLFRNRGGSTDVFIVLSWHHPSIGRCKLTPGLTVPPY